MSFYWDRFTGDMLTMMCRKDILPNMQSATKIVWVLHKEIKPIRVVHQILCKDWKVLMLLGLNVHKSSLLFILFIARRLGLLNANRRRGMLEKGQEDGIALLGLETIIS